ncbi:MAG TPA: hypothetical protein VGG19_04395 [Tepidisphaeraceae bacterium]
MSLRLGTAGTYDKSASRHKSSGSPPGSPIKKSWIRRQSNKHRRAQAELRRRIEDRKATVGDIRLPSVSLTISISPHGRLFSEESGEVETGHEHTGLEPIGQKFSESQAAGLLFLATSQLQRNLPEEFAFARDFGCLYLTRLCHMPAGKGVGDPVAIPAPGDEELNALVLAAPPMRGLEYLNADCLARWWAELDELVRREIAASGQSVQEYLRELNPLWRTVGRVTFHLAENKRDSESPFAFLATYATKVSAQGRVQHLPLGRALQEYAGEKNRSALLALLQPIQRAAERNVWVKELVDSGEVYHPLAWTPREAHQFLQIIPELEESGLMGDV